jgi:hypothetical protein
MISASNVNTHTVGFQQHFYQASKALRLPTDFQMQTSTMNAHPQLTFVNNTCIHHHHHHHQPM